ncbi:MAG TPA: NAD(P)/FAD-dependent oxidoreductase [Chloroflexia bacterium]|nr:NAD(P)/FAD-dependent oxidoreductase [Chloroflexia bacterium]
MARAPETQQPGARRARRPRVVILGAGFGGLSAARALAGSGASVLVLDRNNYHGFWPLLYQVATAGLEPESIAYPVRAILRRYRNVGFRMGEVTGLDLPRRQVIVGGTTIPYDYLILAAGSANNYFGNEALAAQTYGLKDIGDAERLRNHILRVFEQAVGEPNPARRQALLTVAIVGGGPTGVELAGAVAELIHGVLRKDYPMLDTARAGIVLVEATTKILAAFPESLQRSARRRLAELGVEVKFGATVAAVAAGQVTFQDGTHLAAATVVWAAGVRGAHLVDGLGLPLGRGARVRVQPTLNLAAHPEVFIIGDLAYLEGYKDGQPYPQVAPVAMQQGRLAARNILAQLRGQPPAPFHYFDKGSMATIGRRAAVFDAFGIRLTGVVAWFGWLFLHLIYLIGFRNRVIVLANWAYNYFTYDRGVRLISDDGV